MRGSAEPAKVSSTLVLVSRYFVTSKAEATSSLMPHTLVGLKLVYEALSY
jgi:hypothetical protein